MTKLVGVIRGLSYSLNESQIQSVQNDSVNFLRPLLNTELNTEPDFFADLLSDGRISLASECADIKEIGYRLEGDCLSLNLLLHWTVNNPDNIDFEELLEENDWDANDMLDFVGLDIDEFEELGCDEKSLSAA